MRRFLAPEVVQTSSMDCGPASLKCLLEGFGRHVSYGRLREACQTGIDGTSIDTMEAVANQLGLEAEQIMLPADHLLLKETRALPAIVVVKLANGLTHFVIAWRMHGRMVQVMDPAMGRRWVSRERFLADTYSHTMPVPAAGWFEFVSSDDFQHALKARMRRIGLRAGEIARWIEEALREKSWEQIASLDAAVRLVTALAEAGVARRNDAAELLGTFRSHPELIPLEYWSVRGGPDDEDGNAQVVMRGAVLVRVRRVRERVAEEDLSPELVAAVKESPLSAARELLRLVRASGDAGAGVAVAALAAGAGGVLIEALLFRALFDIAGNLHLAGQRIGAIAALLAFGAALLLLEAGVFAEGMRLGRQMETRLRLAFLRKLPRLSDRYFQSRLTSDMAERSHATHRLRHLPELWRQLLRTIFELCAMAAGIIWLEPSAAVLVVLIVLAAVIPPLIVQPLLAERDLRTRNHAAALTRFNLDAMLGFSAIRAHGAERSLRREHENVLGEWAHAALRLQKAVASAEGVQLVAMFGLVCALLLLHPLQGPDMGRILLVVYWALNLPVSGQDIASLARQYPYYRNITLRLLEPLGASEENAPAGEGTAAPSSRAPSIEFREVSATAGGHRILEGIDLRIEPGEHVAIIGSSGAGKSSLVGILLGWLKPQGAVLVDGAPLDCDRVRQMTAWVDPSVQLWNRSLFSNLAYGSNPDAFAVGQAIDAALLRRVLENLPEGLETPLGEGGALVSGGEGQRVRLGRAMLRKNVRLAILDEPFRGLDRDKRRELLTRARGVWRDCTFLCITHDVAETQVFDRVVVVEQGRIAETGTPDELSANAESRYAQLLAAEEQTRSGLWAANIWRRITVHRGGLTEEVPAATPEQTAETEVA